MDNIGVIIGRFQTDTLHAAHREIIKTVAESHKEIIIFVGTRDTPPTAKNPMSYAARKHLFDTVHCYLNSNINVTVLPLKDMQTNMAWSRQIDAAISQCYGFAASATIYSSRDGCIEHYIGKHKTKSIEILEYENISATDIRNGIKNEVLPTVDFRKGIIHAMTNLTPRVYTTVDICMYQRWSDGSGYYILLGKRNNEEGYRFPGGFVDTKDADFEAAARRELFEETGMSIEHGLHYIGSYHCDDWRIKNQSDVSQITTLFATQYTYGIPKAADDLDSLAWVNINKLSPFQLVEDHRKFLEPIKTFISRIS